jgi:hypothetical protein
MTDQKTLPYIPTALWSHIMSFLITEKKRIHRTELNGGTELTSGTELIRDTDTQHARKNTGYYDNNEWPNYAVWALSQSQVSLGYRNQIIRTFRKKYDYLVVPDDFKISYCLLHSTNLVLQKGTLLLHAMSRSIEIGCSVVLFERIVVSLDINSNTHRNRRSDLVTMMGKERYFFWKRLINLSKFCPDLFARIIDHFIKLWWKFAEIESVVEIFLDTAYQIGFDGSVDSKILQTINRIAYPSNQHKIFQKITLMIIQGTVDGEQEKLFNHMIVNHIKVPDNIHALKKNAMNIKHQDIINRIITYCFCAKNGNTEQLELLIAANGGKIDTCLMDNNVIFKNFGMFCVAIKHYDIEKNGDPEFGARFLIRVFENGSAPIIRVVLDRMPDFFSQLDNEVKTNVLVNMMYHTVMWGNEEIMNAIIERKLCTHEIAIQVLERLLIDFQKSVLHEHICVRQKTNQCIVQLMNQIGNDFENGSFIWQRCCETLQTNYQRIKFLINVQKRHGITVSQYTTDIINKFRKLYIT